MIAFLKEYLNCKRIQACRRMSQRIKEANIGSDRPWISWNMTLANTRDKTASSH